MHSDSSAAITGAEDGSVRITNIANARVLGQLEGAARGVGRATVLGASAAVHRGHHICDVTLQPLKATLRKTSLRGVHFTVLHQYHIHQAHVALINQHRYHLQLTTLHYNLALLFPLGHDDSVEAVGFSSHLPLAASAGVDTKLLVWDCASFAQRGVCEHPDVVTRLAWSPAAPLVASACLDGVVRLWDLRTAAAVKKFEGHQVRRLLLISSAELRPCRVICLCGDVSGYVWMAKFGCGACAVKQHAAISNAGCTLLPNRCTTAGCTH